MQAALAEEREKSRGFALQLLALQRLLIREKKEKEEWKKAGVYLASIFHPDLLNQANQNGPRRISPPSPVPASVTAISNLRPSVLFFCIDRSAFPISQLTLVQNNA